MVRGWCAREVMVLGAVALFGILLPAMAWAQLAESPGPSAEKKACSSLACSSLAVINGSSYSVADFTAVANLSEAYRVFLEPPFVENQNMRRQAISSNFGEAQVFWSASSGQMVINDLPQLVAEVLTVVHQTLVEHSFPVEASIPADNWNIVMLPSIPSLESRGLLSSARCHTAWVGPPANVVIAADRLLTCHQSSSVKEIRSALRTILIHETAHAVEFRLMGEGFAHRQRWHSEGFALWFEALVAAQEAREDGNPRSRSRLDKVQKGSVESWRSYLFRGTATDYQQSYARIARVADGLSLDKLLAVYAVMGTDNSPFLKAVEKELGWTEAQWAKETALFAQQLQ